MRERLAATHKAREAGLVASRAAIRAASVAIRAAHRREWDRATELVAESASLISDAHDALRDQPTVYYAGFLHDGEKEYAEAALTLALVRSGGDVGSLPGPVELGLGDAAWLNGLAEAIGELRRFLLDRLREGDVELGERLLAAMDGIHDLLASLDFPDAITGGLRRSADVARAIIERTRGDLTATAVQARLTRALEERARS